MPFLLLAATLVLTPPPAAAASAPTVRPLPESIATSVAALSTELRLPPVPTGRNAHDAWARIEATPSVITDDDLDAVLALIGPGPLTASASAQLDDYFDRQDDRITLLAEGARADAFWAPRLNRFSGDLQIRTGFGSAGRLTLERARLHAHRGDLEAMRADLDLVHRTVSLVRDGQTSVIATIMGGDLEHALHRTVIELARRGRLPDDELVVWQQRMLACDANVRAYQDAVRYELEQIVVPALVELIDEAPPAMTWSADMVCAHLEQRAAHVPNTALDPRTHAIIEQAAPFLDTDAVIVRFAAWHAEVIDVLELPYHTAVERTAVLEADMDAVRAEFTERLERISNADLPAYTDPTSPNGLVSAILAASADDASEQRLNELTRIAPRLRNLLGVQFEGLMARNDAHFVRSAHLRTARARGAGVAVAIVRFERAHDRWPTTLDELVAAGLIDHLPDDPLRDDGETFIWRADPPLLAARLYCRCGECRSDPTVRWWEEPDHLVVGDSLGWAFGAPVQ